MSRRSKRISNRNNDVNAFANTFGEQTTAPAAPIVPQVVVPTITTAAAAPTAIQRLAEGTGLQVDAVAPQQHVPPTFQNTGAVVEALAAAAAAAPAANNVAQLAAPAAAAGAQVPTNPPQQQAPSPRRQPTARRRQPARRRQSHNRRAARPPRTEQSAREKYEVCLRNLMDWKYHRIHMRGHEFTHEQLISLTDLDIYRWMKHRVYGDADADETTTPPIHYRHYSVLFWKKAISAFMVNSHMQWNEETGMGNPTRSKRVLKLLKYIKRFQTQSRGKKSQTVRAFTQEEFEQVQELIWAMDDTEDSLCGAAYFAFQYNMMARLDDTAKCKILDLRPYAPNSDCAIMTRLPWSKNVFEERDAPPQILFGAMNPHYDVLSLLGLWLEYRYKMHPEESEFMFCYDGEEDPIRIKDHLRAIMTHILKHDDFVIRDLGSLGTHSTRKFSVTFSRGMGCSKVR